MFDKQYWIRLDFSVNWNKLVNYFWDISSQQDVLGCLYWFSMIASLFYELLKISITRSSWPDYFKIVILIFWNNFSNSVERKYSMRKREFFCFKSMFEDAIKNQIRKSPVFLSYSFPNSQANSYFYCLRICIHRKLNK